MKIQSPWMGRIRGSAGNMTGCKVYDKNVMRAKAFEVNNPNTAAQQVQRGYFADLTKLVADFSPDQLRTLFPSKPKAMSRRNALSKQLAEYNTMSGTEKIVDFANIDTFGNAPTLPMNKISATWVENQLDIDWSSVFTAHPEYANNIVILGLVNVSKKNILMMNTGEIVSYEEIMIQAPSGWETTDVVNAIVFLADESARESSFGSFIIKMRPEKKSN